MSEYIDKAERNANGDLIYKKTVPSGPTSTKEVDVNVTHMYQPGPRKTSRVERIIREAEVVAEGTHLANPLRPASDTTALRAVEALNELDLTPAWEVAPEVDFP